MASDLQTGSMISLLRGLIVTDPSSHSTTPPARLKLSRRGWSVILAGLLMVVFATVGSILMLWQARETVLEEWKVNLSNMSITLAESTNQTMKAADLVLKSITDRVEEADIANDDELRREMGTHEIYDMLRNKASSVPQIDVATIVARDGDIINFTRSYPPPGSTSPTATTSRPTWPPRHSTSS